MLLKLWFGLSVPSERSIAAIDVLRAVPPPTAPSSEPVCPTQEL